MNALGLSIAVIDDLLLEVKTDIENVSELSQDEQFSVLSRQQTINHIRQLSTMLEVLADGLEATKENMNSDLDEEDDFDEEDD
jgi:hypothetical protein